MKNLLVNPIIHVVAVSSLDHSRYRFRTVSLFFSSVVRPFARVKVSNNSGSCFRSKYDSWTLSSRL